MRDPKGRQTQSLLRSASSQFAPGAAKVGYRLFVFFSVNGGVKLGHGAAQNWATLGLRGTRVMSGGQSAALSM